MPLALETLSFQVETQRLKDAKDAIDALAVSMANLNKAQVQEAKVAKDSAKSKESLVKSTEESTESTKKSTTVLERQQSILEFMTQGFSKGQSSVLAYAKSSGALTQELKELGGVLQIQRKLIGGDTFDKSMSGLIALKNQYGEIKEAIRQYNADSELTRNQTRELTRDKERLIEKMKLEGAAFTEIKKAVKEYNQVYTDQASKVNSLLKVEKDRERSARDHANAIRNVQSAEERLFATVQNINSGLSANATLNERAALAVGSYERNLRLAGITGEASAKKLQAFRAAQAEITAMENKRSSDYVARGVGIQMGDVGVSLAGGMNPLLVMIQQGDQLRSLIQQAGRDGLDLKNVMNDAAAQIVRSFKDVGIAVGTFVSGAFISAGKSIKDAFLAPALLAGRLMQNLFSKENMNLDIGPQVSNSTLAWRDFTTTLKGAIPVFAGIAAVITGAFLLAVVQVTKATNEMNSQILQFGASLGVTLPQAKELAASLSNSNLGVTFTSSLEAVGKFAKSGISDFDTLNSAVTSAIELQKYLGIEVEKTAEQYAAVAKDPVKGLIEIAKNTGLVTEAQIRNIDSLEKTKGKSVAVKAAMDLVTSSMKTLASESHDSLTDVEKLWIDIKDAVASAWGQIQKAADGVEIFKGFRDIFAKLKLAVTTTFNVLSGMAALMYEIFSGNFDTGMVNSFITDANTKAIADYDATLKDVYTTSKKTTSQLEEEAKARQKNALAANGLEKVLKDEDKAKKKANSEGQKEAERVQKAYEKHLERISDLQTQVNRVNSDGDKEIIETTKAYGLLQDIMDDPAWEKYNDTKKIAILQAYAEVASIEVENFLLKEQTKAITALDKMWQDFNKSRVKGSADIKATTDELDFQYSILGKSEKEIRAMTIAYEEQKNIAKITTDYEVERLDIMQKYAAAAAGLYGDELETQAKILLSAISDLAIEEEHKVMLEREKSNLKVAQDYQKRWDRIQDGISNALYDSLFEGGKKGAESIRKLIEDELKREFILPAIKVLVNYATGAVGSFGNSVINGVLGTSSNNGGAGTNWLGLANNVSSLNTAYGALAQYVTGGAVGASTASLAYANGVGMVGGDSLGALYTANGGWAGVGVDGAASTGASTSGMGASAVGWIAAIVMGMYMSGEAWQNGIRWENYAKDDDAKKYDAEVGIRALHDEPARAIFGDKFVDSKFYAVAGGGSLSAMIHGAVQKGLWGGDWQPDGSDSRLSGTFSESSTGFDGGKISQDFHKDGGWFRSDKKETRSQDVSADLDSVLDQMYLTIRNSMVMAGALFEDHTLADKLKDFTFSITDLSGSKLDESITKASDQLAEAMGKTLFPSIEAMRINVVDQAASLKIDLEQAKRTGNVALASNIEAQIKNLEGLDNETWFSAFGRIMQDANAVGRVLDLMGESITDVFGEGNANRVLLLSESMAQMFGGIDNLNQSFSAYYANFYSQEEQRAKAMEDMGKAFTSLNLTMPTSREGFRALVDGLDLATIGGQATFKAMMDLQSGFAALVPAIEDTAIEDKAIEDKAIEDKAAAERKSLQDEYDSLTMTSTELLTKQRDALDASNRSLFDQINAINKANGIADSKAGILGQIFDAQLDGMDDAGKVAALKIKESGLWDMLNAGDISVVDDLSSTVLERISIESQAYQTQIDSANTMLDSMKRLRDFGEQMHNSVLGLSAGDLSPLSYIDQLSAAQQQWTETLAKARSGDESAMSALSSTGQAYLQEARSYYGANADYASVFGSVTGNMESFGALSPTDIQIENQTLLVDSMSITANNSSEQVIQLRKIADVLTTQQDTMDGQGVQASEGTLALISRLEALLDRVDAIESSNRLVATI